MLERKDVEEIAKRVGLTVSYMDEERKDIGFVVTKRDGDYSEFLTMSFDMWKHIVPYLYWSGDDEEQ